MYMYIICIYIYIYTHTHTLQLPDIFGTVQKARRSYKTISTACLFTVLDAEIGH